jgi:hypothetical protein
MTRISQPVIVVELISRRDAPDRASEPASPRSTPTPEERPSAMSRHGDPVNILSCQVSVKSLVDAPDPPYFMTCSALSPLITIRSTTRQRHVPSMMPSTRLNFLSCPPSRQHGHSWHRMSMSHVRSRDTVYMDNDMTIFAMTIFQTLVHGR